MPALLEQNPRRAALVMVVATAFIAGTTLLAKAIGTGALGAPLHPLQISFGRFFFAWLVIVAFFAWRRPSLARPHYSLHFARTLCGWGGVTLMFAAVAWMPLSDATALSFLSPVITMLLAIPLLGERVGPWRWAAAAIALIGALILLRPGAGVVQLAGLLALGAAAVMGLESIFIKKLTRIEDTVPILLVNNTMGFAIAALAAAFVWAPPTAGQWGALAGIGCLMIAGQACFLLAMRLADASFVAPIFYLVLAFAAVYDFWIFGVRPDGISILGAAVLVAGAVLLAWREGRARRLRA
jgi:drug/metabolite transporter (DMT)-like permease